MKTLPKIPAIMLFALILLSSCGPQLSPFTQSLYEQNAWSSDELKRIQFYLSDRVVLRRQKTRGNSNIEDGKIRMKSGRNIEEIIIPKGTPGVLTYLPRENRFAVSFEDGRSGRSLIFGPDSRGGNRYVLKVAKWEGERGFIRYDDKNYFIYRSDALTTLMVDLKKVRQTSVRSRVAGGKKL